MKQLFVYLKTRILANVPEIKTVRMFNDQPTRSNKKPRTEKAFKYPACFIEFQVVETYNRCLKVVDYLLTVRFRFALEGYKFERIETFDFCDRFKAEVQLMAPVPLAMFFYDESENEPIYFYEESPTYTHNKFTLTFTTFQEISTEFDEQWDNVEQPHIDYRTLYRSTVAYDELSTIQLSDILTPVTVTDEI